MKMTLLTLAALILAAPAVHASGPVRAAQKKAQAAPAPATLEGADAMSDEDARAQMNAFLGSIDTPIPAAHWQALGQRVGPWLEEIARGTDLPTRRAKALDGMAASKWTGAAGVMRELARDEATPANVRFHAVRGLAHVLPKDKVERELTPLLEGAKDARVRASAAEQLTKLGLACGAVDRQLAREDEGGKLMFHAAVDSCAALKKK